MKRAEILPPGVVLPPMTPETGVPPSALPPHETMDGRATPAVPRAPAGKPAGTIRGRRRDHADRFKTLNTFVDATLRDLSPREALAWLVLYRDTKPDGLARTGFTDLATRTGCSVATAKRVVKSLRRRGLVQRVRKGAPGSGPNVYKIVAAPLPAGDEPPAPAAGH